MQMKDFDGVIASVKGLFWLAVIVGAIVIAGQAYDVADHDGWISHSRSTQVKYPHHGWEVGEYVTCAAVDRILNCEDNFLEPGTVREMDVVFWGQVGPKPTIYRCQRGENSITCHLSESPATTNPNASQ